MNLRDAITKRQSIRTYSHKKPDWRKILASLEAATFAPTAGNLYSLKFILISDKKIIENIAPLTMQDFVGSAPYLIVAVTDGGKLERSYGEKGRIYATQQAGAAIQNFLLAATENKLATCWVGYFDEPGIKELLKIPEKMTVEALFPVGLPSAKTTKQQKKVAFENVIYFDTWNNSTNNPQTRITNEGA